MAWAHWKDEDNKLAICFADKGGIAADLTVSLTVELVDRETYVRGDDIPLEPHMETLLQFMLCEELARHAAMLAARIGNPTLVQYYQRQSGEFAAKIEKEKRELKIAHSFTDTTGPKTLGTGLYPPVASAMDT